MRKFLIAAAALALAACVSAPPVELVPAPTQPLRLVGVGTIATNACEAAVAGDYTGVITARLTAAKALREGKLPVARAVAVQTKADEARAALDRACPGGKPDQAQIDKARAARAEIAKLMEVKP
jgi:hypothetical protein